MARFGWWRADFHTNVLICSDFIIDLFDLKTNIIPFKDFFYLVREDCRARIIRDFDIRLGEEVYEQHFPVRTRLGETWILVKFGLKETDNKGYPSALGFIQCIMEQTLLTCPQSQQVNNLLYQQNSISKSLLSFLKTEDISNVIHKILHEVREQFAGSRVYIFEYDKKYTLQSCTFEVTAEGVSSKQEQLQNVSTVDTCWWTHQLLNYSPIILSSLDELPPEAAYEKQMLEEQDIKSIMAVPMITWDRVWGYLGIDLINTNRKWNDNDYQWLAALGNIISICIELRKSENQARTEQEYFRNLYFHMPLGYARLKMLRNDAKKIVNYRFEEVNPAFEKIVGRPPSNFIGKTAYEAGIDPDFIEKQLQYMTLVLEENRYQEHNDKLAGTYCHFMLYSPEKEEIICLFTDISESIQMHQSLDESEKILQNIYKNIPVGIEVYDKNGNLCDINDKDIEISGELNKKCKPFNLFEHPSIPAHVIELIKDRKCVDFIIKHDPSDSSDRLLENKEPKDLVIKINPLFDSNNELKNYLVIIVDNTETSSTCTKVRDFESFFSVIAGFAKIGYFKWNPLTKKGFAIWQWYRNWGESEDTPLSDIIGVYQHAHPDDVDKLKDFFKAVHHGKVRNLKEEIRVKTPEGGWKWILCNVTVKEFDPENNIIDIIGVNFDISELKLIETKLIEAKNKAETLDKLKSAFLANMSHEIRTPLNAIVGFSNLLIDTEDYDEKIQYISIIQENNELLLQLISDILDLSKIEAGTFEIIYNKVDINLLCSEIVRTMSMKATNEVKIRFENQLPHCCIYSDRNRLMQVITNFINNALKFTLVGNINLGYNVFGKEIEFYVRDTGIGISQEQADKIFDRFVKLNSFINGTGLGLSICKSIVEQMKGKIGVTSDKEIGSRFWFTIPYLPVDGDENEESTQSLYGKPKPIILVAEDADSNYILVSTMLKKEYDIVRAYDGKETIRLYDTVSPNMILMDLKMPEIDGFTATRHIRETNPDIPIIALTALAFDSDREKAFEAGCNEYIAKPITPHILKEIVKKYLN